MQQRTPAEVVRLLRGRGDRGRRREVLRPAGDDAALLGAGPHARRGRSSPRASASTARPSAGSRQIHESDMILLPGPRHRVRRPVPRAQDAQPQLLRPRPGHRRALLPRPPLRRQEGRGSYLRDDRHRRHRLLRARGGVLHLRRRPLRPGRQLRLLPGRLGRGPLEHRDGGAPNLGYKLRPKEGYFPVPPSDHFQDLRSEMILTMERLGDRGRDPAPRGGDGGPGRDRHAASTPCCAWPTS